MPYCRQYFFMRCDVRGVAVVVDEDDVDLAPAFGHLGETHDVVARPLERQLVDVLVLLALVADVDEDACSSPASRSARPFSSLSIEPLLDIATSKPASLDLPDEVGRVAVEQRFTEPAEADR